jgi:hypothetical protein
MIRKNTEVRLIVLHTCGIVLCLESFQKFESVKKKSKAVH